MALRNRAFAMWTQFAQIYSQIPNVCVSERLPTRRPLKDGTDLDCTEKKHLNLPRYRNRLTSPCQKVQLHTLYVTRRVPQCAVEKNGLGQKVLCLTSPGEEGQNLVEPICSQISLRSIRAATESMVEWFIRIPFHGFPFCVLDGHSTFWGRPKILLRQQI